MISFVVPAHKEQACLGRTLQAIHESARWVCRTKSFRPPIFHQADLEFSATSGSTRPAWTRILLSS